MIVLVGEDVGVVVEEAAMLGAMVAVVVGRCTVVSDGKVPGELVDLILQLVINIPKSITYLSVLIGSTPLFCWCFILIYL